MEADDPFRASSDVIDWQQPEVCALARQLGGDVGPTAVAGRCFVWVRDRIRHSGDHRDPVVTVAASEVLRHGTGLCFAKSHLLCALLRANGLRAGLGYQRLSQNDVGPPYCLHGIVAVELPGTAWLRLDPRGDRPGLGTQFAPPAESLAFTPRLPGERTYDAVWPEPLPIVVARLRECATVAALLANLPDWEEDGIASDGPQP